MLDIMQFPDPEAFLQAFRHFQESEIQYQGDAQTLNAGQSTLAESWQGDGSTAYNQSHSQIQQAGQMHQEQRQQVAAMLSSTVAPLGEAQMLQDTAMSMMEESEMLTAQAAVEAADPFTAPAAAATEAAAEELAAQAQMTQASAQAIVQGVCANWAATLQGMMGTMNVGSLGDMGGRGPVPGTPSSGDSNSGSNSNNNGGNNGRGGNNKPPDEGDEDPLANVKPSDELLGIYQQQADAVFGPYAQAHGMTLEEYQQALDGRAQSLLENAHPWMRVRPNDLEVILQDGKFKSGFETGSLTGMKADFRTATENGLFGYPVDMDPAARPLYGYPSADPNGGGYPAVDNYGPIAIRFNDDVGRRATVTFGDTLTASNGTDELTMVATPFKNPDGRSFQTFIPGESAPDPLNTSDAKLLKYSELQYHGGLSTQDIAEVVFHDKPSQNILDILQNRGIPYKIK